MDDNNFLFAFLLTLFAGLSTGIGSFIALKTRKLNYKFLSASLGFSAGVMLYVSFAEILIKGETALVSYYGEFNGLWLTTIGFFIGISTTILIDKLIPNADFKINDEKTLLRTGVFTAIAIAIHNFPEGLATFTSAISDPVLGLPITTAIAIHNIPEGIAVAVPIYFATKNKQKAFLYSLFSGITEPIGAVVGYLLFSNFFNDATFGFIFSFVAGMMVYISIGELLPSAKEYDKGHISIYWAVLGMLVMAISLLLFI